MLPLTQRVGRFIRNYHVSLIEYLAISLLLILIFVTGVQYFSIDWSQHYDPAHHPAQRVPSAAMNTSQRVPDAAISTAHHASAKP